MWGECTNAWTAQYLEFCCSTSRAQWVKASPRDTLSLNSCRLAGSFFSRAACLKKCNKTWGWDALDIWGNLVSVDVISSMRLYLECFCSCMVLHYFCSCKMETIWSQSLYLLHYYMSFSGCCYQKRITIVHLTSMKGPFRGSVSCPRTHADWEDWGSNCRPSGWRTTTLPLCRSRKKIMWLCPHVTKSSIQHWYGLTWEMHEGNFTAYNLHFHNSQHSIWCKCQRSRGGLKRWHHNRPDWDSQTSSVLTQKACRPPSDLYTTTGLMDARIKPDTWEVAAVELRSRLSETQRTRWEYLVRCVVSVNQGTRVSSSHMKICQLDHVQYNSNSYFCPVV